MKKISNIKVIMAAFLLCLTSIHIQSANAAGSWIQLYNVLNSDNGYALVTFSLGYDVKKGDVVQLTDSYRTEQGLKNKGWFAEWDGGTRSITVQIPSGYAHNLTASVIAVTQDGRSYCGLESSSANIVFSGASSVKSLPKPSVQWKVGYKKCSNHIVRGAGLRIDVFSGLLFANKPTAIVGYQSIPAPELDTLKVFVSNCDGMGCRDTTLEETAQNELTIPVGEAKSACFVKATAFTRDQDRDIAAKTAVINLNGSNCTYAESGL